MLATLTRHLRTTLRRRLHSTKSPPPPANNNTALQIVTSVFQFSAIIYCVQTYLIDVTMCVGPSMLPTLNSAGDIVLLSRWLHRYRAVEVNDVVLAKSPTNPDQIVCKRVVGLSGDHVKYNRPRCGNMEFSYAKDGLVVPDGYVLTIHLYWQ